MALAVPGGDGPLEAVIFDWGGTLIPHVDDELIDMWRLAAEQLDPSRAEEIVEALVTVERASWVRTHGSQRSARLMDLMLTAGDELDLDVAGAVLGAAGQRPLSEWATSISHRADAVPVLRAIRGAGLKVGMVTNTRWPRAFHQQFLEADGLAELIDHVLYTSEIDWVKPHPQPFVTVAKRLRVAVDGCVFVGDRPINDMQGASEVGMAAVWLAGDHAPGEPDTAVATIKSLAELPAVLGL